MATFSPSRPDLDTAAGPSVRRVDPKRLALDRAHSSKRALIPRVVLGFAFVWALNSLLGSGDLLKAEHYSYVLRTPPSIQQAHDGDAYAQTLLILRQLPAHDRLLVIWKMTQPSVEYGYWYAYLWANYWLYPRQVDVTIDPGVVNLTNYDRLLFVHPPDVSAPQPPPGYSQQLDRGTPGEQVELFGHANG
jgi:hypothetical protein